MIVAVVYLTCLLFLLEPSQSLFGANERLRRVLTALTAGSHVSRLYE